MIDAEDTDAVIVLAAYVAHRHECYTSTDAIKADFLTYLYRTNLLEGIVNMKVICYTAYEA